MNLNSLEIQSRIKQILADEVQVDPLVLETADAAMPLLGRGIGLDSVEALRLTLGLENAFEISIPDADLTVELFASIGSLSQYVQDKLQARSAVLPPS